MELLHSEFLHRWMITLGERTEVWCDKREVAVEYFSPLVKILNSSDKCSF